MAHSTKYRLLTTSWLLGATTFLGCQGTQSQTDHIPPYEIVEVVPGVYAAIANVGGSAGANAGIINMGESAIVYDTGLTPEAGRQLKAFAEELTGQGVSFVINSHFHDDHTGGNQAFDAPSYISTTATQSAMEAAGTERSSESVEQARTLLNEINGKLAYETNDQARIELAVVAGSMQGIIESGDDFRRVVPTVVWDSRLNFTGSLHRIKFMPTLASHTAGDALLWLEADSVLFTSDIVTTDRHPMMQDGDPDGWMTVLDSVLTLDFNVIVPGHGPLGDRQSVLRMQEYLRAIERGAEEALAGTSVERVAIDSAFSDWMMESRFRSNVRFVMEFRKGKE